jgi:hypothetical protein
MKTKMRLKPNALPAVFVTVAMLLANPSSAQDDAQQSLAGAITAGQAGLNFRFRYEHVDQDGFAENAIAATLRVRLNYLTGDWMNWSGFTEFDYIGEVLLHEFNNLGGSSPDRNRYPVVADPKGPDLNQLYLDYDGFVDSKLRVGRQRINLDNQRFVGGVGWRQNEQTFDSASLMYGGLPKTNLFYSYVTAVRRVFGDEVPAGRNDTDTHLLNGSIGLNGDWTLTPYVYYIDNADVASFSTSTIGARLTGGIAVGKSKLNVEAELATQSDAANNPVSYDAQYINLGASWVLSNGLSLGLSWESLGGDTSTAGASFRTPLATLHPFQGWADQFLTTPDEGIDDFYVTVAYKMDDWTFTGVYHDFSAQAGSQDWGTEIDLSANLRLGEHYALLFKAALYDARQHAADTSKVWIMLTSSY